MKTYLKVTALAALALLGTAPMMRAATDSNASAPTRQTRMQEMRERRMQQLDEKLHLTPEQKTKINAIWDNAGKQAMNNRKESAESRRELRQKQRDEMKATHAQIRDVLTEDQKKIFDTMPRERPGRPGAGSDDRK